MVAAVSIGIFWELGQAVMRKIRPPSSTQKTEVAASSETSIIRLNGVKSQKPVTFTFLYKEILTMS
jgi:hypothetical protein